MQNIKAAKNFIYNFARAKTVEGSIQRNFRRGQLRVESANCAIIRNDKEVNVCETKKGKGEKQKRDRAKINKYDGDTRASYNITGRERSGI